MFQIYRSNIIWFRKFQVKHHY